MWTPPEKIRHPIAPARWPSAEEAASSLWFSPIDVGPHRCPEVAGNKNDLH